MAAKITKGNKSNLSVALIISKEFFAKLFGDKAYISKAFFINSSSMVYVYLLIFVKICKHIY
ncbi:transposase DDE domain protein [Orientia tsutsugamushi str. UT76]|nr:transposase DDE domain protein [Orientia tsutsugamushi str. UT76]